MATAILIVQLTDVTVKAEIARTAESGELAGLGGDLLHPSLGLLVLLVVQFLNVYKPKGLPPCGWHKQLEERRSRYERQEASSA